MASDDPADMARTARVTASSWAGEQWEPENTTSNVSRPRKGVTNAWANAPGAAGQWLQLTWYAVRPVGEVRLTFDTNLEPNFAFSIFPYVRHRVHAPVPETIADYRITGERRRPGPPLRSARILGT